jgi:hypothetical protein
MLKSKAIFERKTDDFRPKDCVIEKVIELTVQEYDAFSQEGNHSLGNDIIAGTFFVVGSNDEQAIFSNAD